MLQVFQICKQIRKENYFHDDMKCANLGVTEDTHTLVFLDLDSLRPMRPLAHSIYSTYSSVRTTFFQDYKKARSEALNHGNYSDRTLPKSQVIERIIAEEVTDLIFWSGQIATLIEMLYYAKIDATESLFHKYCSISKKKTEMKFHHANAKGGPTFLLEAANALLEHIINFFSAFPGLSTLKDSVTQELETMITQIDMLKSSIGTNETKFLELGGPAN